MADVAARTNDLLTAADAFGSNYFGVIDALNEVADLLEQSADLNDFTSVFWSLPPGRLEQLLPVKWVVDGLDGDAEARAQQLRRMADDLGEGIVDPLRQWLVWCYGVDVEQLWPQLEAMSRHLESIARKQLAGCEIDSEDETFIKSYGSRLAEIMLYAGNYSAEHPEDDAPRIADVYSNSEVEANLHVGISRARAMYVLYPWDGGVVLCRGAVMPYYEFVDGGRLTDTEWKTRLDSDTRPDVPSWLRPIIGAEGLSNPQFDDIPSARSR